MTDYRDYDEWEKKNPKIPFDPKPGEKVPPFNPNPPDTKPKPKKPKDPDKNKDRNEKIAGALGAAAKIADSLKDPGLGVTFGSDPVRSGASHSRSGTAEGGPDYWRSHRNESGSPNDNDEY